MTGSATAGQATAADPHQHGRAGAGPEFFGGGRPAAPAGSGRSFRPSSWRRSSRKTGTPDPFATPTADWPPSQGTDKPPTSASGAGAGAGGGADDQRPAGGVAVGDYALGELPPFDGFARGAANSGKSDHHGGPASAAMRRANDGAASGPAAQRSASTEAAPYVPAPATLPLPPEVLNAAHGADTSRPGATPAASPRPAGRAGRAGQSEGRTGRQDEGRHDEGRQDKGWHDEGRHDEGRHDEGRHDEGRQDEGRHDGDRPGQHDQDRPGRHDRGPQTEAAKPKTKRWGRGRSKAADTEQPAPMQSETSTAGQPLVPEPRAVSAPLPNPEPITPPIAAPTPVQGSVADRRRPPRQKPGDDDYVDWVSGLGSQ
jgi:hypothetical protein